GTESAMAMPVEEICGKATPMKTNRRRTRKTPTKGQAKPISTLVYTELRSRKSGERIWRSDSISTHFHFKNFRQSFPRKQFGHRTVQDLSLVEPDDLLGVLAH